MTDEQAQVLYETGREIVCALHELNRRVRDLEQAILLLAPAQQPEPESRRKGKAA